MILFFNLIVLANVAFAALFWYALVAGIVQNDLAAWSLAMLLMAIGDLALARSLKRRRTPPPDNNDMGKRFEGLIYPKPHRPDRIH